MSSRITGPMTDDAVLAEVGARVQRLRLAGNVTQAELAREAGVSVPTLQRLEAGGSVQMVSLLRVLRALGILDHVELLVPADDVRPMDLLARAGGRRRASRRGRPDPAAPWTWAE